MCLMGLAVLWASVGGMADLRADTVPYRHFKSFDGLPSENITALAQSPNGLLWIGTETGLAVYDGQELRTIPLPDSIGTTYVSAIKALSSGAVWVTPSTGEALKVRHHGVVRTVSLGDRLVQRILRRDDSLVFVTRTAVWRLPPDATTPKRQPFRYPIRPAEVGAGDVGAGIFSAALGPDGTIWVLDGHLGPGRLQPNGSVQFIGATPQPNGSFWYDLQFAADGTGLVLQGEQLHRLDPVADTLRTTLDGLGDPTYLSVQGTRAYVTRNQTLLRYDVSTGREHEHLGPEKGLPELQPVEVLHDQEGGLWIGTKEGLLYLMAPEARHVETVGNAPVLNVGQFLPSGDALWVRTYGAGLLQLRPTRRRVAPDGLVGWRQRVESRDEYLHALSSETRIWYRWEAARGWTRVRSTEDAVEGVVTADGIGYFLQEDGLVRYQPDGTGGSRRLDQWASDHVHRHDLGLLPNGDVLHRSEGDFLRRRSSDGRVVDTLATLEENRYRQFQEVLVGPTGKIWCTATYGGLLRIDPATSRRRVILKEHRMWSAEAVRDSLILASSRREGMYLVSATSLTVRRQLTRADGLRSNTVLSTHFTPDTLFVGHDNGVTRLPTDRLFEEQHSPPTLLTGLEVNLEEYPLFADTLLATGERSVGFDYTAPKLANASRVGYQVRLLPRDTSWDATSRPFTRYTNLDPGTYRFEVRARLGRQPPGSPVHYTFTIPPHFYETGWFRLLVVLAVLGVGIAAFRWRTYRLRRRQETLETAVEERTHELQKRTQQLAEEKKTTEQQAERLAELDEAKNRFFAHVSHEFRTPLSLILSPLRDALREAANGRVRFSERQVRRMTRSAERLQRLIDQLLDLATLEAGEMELERRSGDLAAWVRRSAAAFQSKAEQQDIDLSVHTPDAPVESQFDPEKVETIVSNLVGNAVKFTPEGGRVTVRVTQRRAPDGPSETAEEGLSNDDLPTNGVARIEVSDTGPGIDPEVQPTLFDRFEQAHQSSDSDTREQQGTGLGLALSRELVELHGGTIDVESMPGEGATFIVRLPLVPVARARAEKEKNGIRKLGKEEEEGRIGAVGSRATDKTDAGRGREDRDEKPTLLVVEDNAEMRAYLRDELSTQWTVREAADGAEGWTEVQAEPPDLVVSDVMMPEVDGIELCKRIKNDDTLRTVPVLLLTARAGGAAAVEGLEAGADDYVAKPFDTEELRQRIENHLAARRHLKGRYQEEVQLEGLDALTAVDQEAVPILEQVIEAVEGRLENPDFTVGDLASALAMSRRQLTRRLKNAVGETPGDIIYQLRIERAKSLLSQAESVAEVAYAVGYRSPSSFSQSFRKATGMTPSEYIETQSEE